MKNITVYLQKGDIVSVEPVCRGLAFTMGYVFVGSLLVKYSLQTQSEVDIEVSRRWCQSKGFVQLSLPNKRNGEMDKIIGLDIDKDGNARGFGDLSINGNIRAKY